MIQIEKLSSKISPNVEHAYAALFKRPNVGFLNILERDHLWTSSLQRAMAVRSQADQFLFIGIGGSSLGTQALLRACGQKSGQFLFLENVDEVSYEETLELVQDWKRLHIVVTSKSGSTLETIALLEFLAQDPRARNIRWDQQTTVITEVTKNPLNQWAQEHKIPLLEIPKDVGGRFSVLSPVGFLPAALVLGELDPVRSGIQWALKQQDLVCGLAQASIDSFQRGEWMTVLWHYGDQLRDCALWWQQLWAESLAKAKDDQGGRPGRVSTPMVARGAQDQHSLLQQFMEGEKDKWFWFHSISRPSRTVALTAPMVQSPWPLQGHTLANVMNAELQAIEASLVENGVSTLNFKWNDFTAETASAYFMFTQIVVGTLGEFLKINAYDQPGVELGKKRARDILSKKVAASPYQT